MKKRSRILTIVAVLAMCVLMVVGLTACSGGSAEVADVYVADGTLTESGDEYGTKIHSNTTAVLYEDNTYMLIVTTNGYMGEYGNSPVLKGVTISYGTYTLIAEYDDEGTLELSDPTRIITSTIVMSAEPSYLDTADETTFEGSDQTAAEYLEANGKAYSLTINPEERAITGGLS